MPSILNDEDKDTVKRFVPKQSNKIQAVAVARLYVAYPNRSLWKYTGLQGAVVLANDLVGNTYWLKMVDISPSSRGVIWDQEIFDTWSYNQDRTFFHTFELEDCLAGMSFVDEKEAKQFKKKMDEREKNASRTTKSTPFGGGSQPTHKHSLLGGLFGHRHSSAPSPQEATRTNLPPPPPNIPLMSSMSLNNGRPPSEFALLDAFDPLWREHFGQDLSDKGLTDDFIKDNQEFIVDFLREEQAQANGSAPPAPSLPPGTPMNGDTRSQKAPPPPPPGGSPAGSTKKSAPPPPPAPRRSKADPPAREPSPPRAPSPPRPKFNAPPPLADAGKYAKIPETTRKPVASQTSGPPPPPRPGKVPMEPDNSSHKFGVPPAFSGQRPPPTPSRGPVPPPPPPRGNDSHSAAPPPLPPKVPAGGPPPLPPSSSRPVPPPPSSNSLPPLPPPLPPPTSSAAPLPPPLPPTSSAAPLPPPLPPTSSAAPPPPPLPPTSAGGAPPPPPPPPPNRDSGYSSAAPVAPLPPVDKSRSAVLGDIQKAGGIGGLKKVDRSEIRDRSQAQVGGSGDTGSGPPTGGAPAAGGGGGMADALAAALQKRKEKVSRSDDEDDDDDW